MRFCLALPRWAIGAWSLPESMKVAKLVMSSTSPDRSRPNSVTIAPRRRVSISPRSASTEARPSRPRTGDGPARPPASLTTAVPAVVCPPVGEAAAWSTAPPPGSRRPAPGRCPPTRPRPPVAARPRRRSPATSSRCQHRPHRGQVPEPLVPAADRLARPAPRTASPAPPRRCPGTAARRCAACRPPGPTPPGSSRSASRAASPRSTAYMGNTLPSHKPQAPQHKTRRSTTKAGNSR